MANPLVSIIIPVAEKHRELLPLALESVNAQTLQDYEIITIDGERGTAHARNEAVNQSSAPFLTFLDADDYLVNTALEVMVKAYAAYPDACYIYGDHYQFTKDETSLKYIKTRPYDRKAQIQTNVHLVTTLLPRDVFDAVGGFDEEYPAWEDHEFWCRCAVMGYCGVRVPSPILVYRLSTSINREHHNRVGQTTYDALMRKYQPFLEGKENFMACSTCGGNARQEAQRRYKPDAQLPVQQDGRVLMEYLGQNVGSMTFRVNGNTYRGANDDSNKYANVLPADVPALVDKGLWRVVVKPGSTTQTPRVETFTEWRQKQPA